MRFVFLLILSLFFGAGQGFCQDSDQEIDYKKAGSEKPLVVFAPSSMSDVMTDIAKAFERKTKRKVLLSFAGTAQLARQLDAGAPADYFITADRAWLDWALERQLLYRPTVQKLASNRLVLAVSARKEERADLFHLLTQMPFAVAEVETVPAGRYAYQVLQYTGLWARGKENAIFSENVRLTLQRLVLGQVESAIVYKTDAMAEPRVRTVFVFPQKGHAPIHYWGAMTKRHRVVKEMAFASFLHGAEAHSLFKRHGFDDDEDGNVK